MKKIMIYIDNNYIESSIDLIEAAKKIEKNPLVYALGINLDVKRIKPYFNKIINVIGNINEFETRSIAKIIKELNEKEKFFAILVGGNTLGRILAPKISVELDTGIVADVTEIISEENETILVRPAFNGKLMAKIKFEKNKPIVTTIREGIFKYIEKKECNMEIEKLIINVKDTTNIKVLKIENRNKSKDIRESKNLLSYGGGIGSNYKKVYDLERLMNVNISASRKVVDDGYAEKSIQVGQSGKIVSPDIYIALGIYGSIQHIEGLKNIKTLISVNIDKDAPICSISDIVIEGDAIDFIDKLIKKIEDKK